MIAAWRSWWSARTQREQRLLLVMFALLAAAAAWLLVVRPLGEALDAAKVRHAAAVEAVGLARARTASLPAATAGRAAPRPLDAFLSRTAREAGFAGARVAGQGPDHATIAIDAARPQALFGWLRRLEAQGAKVESLSASANQDRTLAVEARLRARGG